MDLFYIDALSSVMFSLVLFISLIVAKFSYSYLGGDFRLKKYYFKMTLLILSLTGLFFSNHLLLFAFFWGVSNTLLVKMMVHKKEWLAAKNSGKLAASNFIVGFGALSLAFLGLYFATGETSLQKILSSTEVPIFALLLLLIAALSQSAIWPFHKWLISSLNSPTPVSALMHAGLVNGGGFLIVRFSPLFALHPNVLTLIFALGIVSALIGTLWKLVQSDVKRTLACSTLAQMGFMLAQCGLGLFAGAIAHLCWHGIYKAYLFLSSGSAAKEKRENLGYPPSLIAFLLALLFGAFGTACYTYFFDQGALFDATLVITCVVFILCSQIALTLTQNKEYLWAVLAATLTGLLYGMNVTLIESVLTPVGLMEPQDFNSLHLVTIAFFMLSWIGVIFRGGREPEWLARIYVLALNSSQPKSKTITAFRNHYKYKRG